MISRVDADTPAKIKGIAKDLGLTYAGEGSQGKLLDALAKGKLMLVHVPNDD
jgi:hypothetical protein